MIEPPKATKGRRMSQKTRKKSSKPSSSRAARAKSAARAKTKITNMSSAATKKSRKSAAGTASHKAASKRLKSSDSTGRPISTQASPPREKAPALVEGSQAPPFTLPRDGGRTVRLSDFAGKKLVLFFYPRADTPGCTREAIDFTRLAGAFAACGTAVLGISADPLRAQEKFRDKHKLTVPLISDEQHEMLQAYGAWGEKSMYGKTFLGILRTTVLIGSDGRIAKIWRNVRVDGHAEEVLAAAKEI